LGKLANITAVALGDIFRSFYGETAVKQFIQTEHKLLTSESRKRLGFSARSNPKSDLYIETPSEAGNLRVWVEFEISRADPIANVAKFCIAFNERKPAKGEVVVFAFSNDISNDKVTQCNRLIELMPNISKHMITTKLFPDVTSSEIKTLNPDKDEYARKVKTLSGKNKKDFQRLEFERISKNFLEINNKSLVQGLNKLANESIDFASSTL